VWVNLWRTAETKVGKQAPFRAKFNVVPRISVWCIMKYIILRYTVVMCEWLKYG
jgi:hypothetical protein